MQRVTSLHIERARVFLRQHGIFGVVRAVATRLGAGLWSALRGKMIVLAEIRFDRRHGSDTAGVTYPTDYVEQVPGAVHYQGVQPSTFARMVAALALDPAEYVFVDLGAGKGRALVLAAHAGFRRVIGVELSPSLARAATRNVAGFPNVEVRVGDATRLELPAAATVVFLYNPFREEAMSRFVDHLESQAPERRAPMLLAYVNPALHALLAERAFVRLRAEARTFKIYEIGFCGNE
jgi:SAM-dependent methyltransferase